MHACMHACIHTCVYTGIRIDAQAVTKAYVGAA